MKQKSTNRNYIIRIEEPCDENWNRMDNKESVRFCTNCNKTVVDFTGKTNTEVLEYLIRNPFTCGRIESNKLNKLLSLNVPHKQPKRNWIAIAAFLAAGIFSVAPIQAQIDSVKQDSIVQTTKLSIHLSNNSERIIYGTVIESNSKESIPYASITLFQNDAIVKGVSADVDGKFSITLPENLKGKFILKISAAGNPAKEFELNTRKIKFPSEVKIELDPGVTMGTFIIITQPDIRITPTGTKYNRQSIMNYPGQ